MNSYLRCFYSSISLSTNWKQSAIAQPFISWAVETGEARSQDVFLLVKGPKAPEVYCYRWLCSLLFFKIWFRDCLEVKLCLSKCCSSQQRAAKELSCFQCFIDRMQVSWTSTKQQSGRCVIADVIFIHHFGNYRMLRRLDFWLFFEACY